MRAARRARRSAGQATGDFVLLCAWLARFHLLSSSGPCPSDQGAALPARSSASVRLCGRRPSSGPRSRARDPLAVFRLSRIERDPRPHAGLLATRVPALGRSPCVPERASSEMPGCGRACAVPLAVRSQPRPALSPMGLRILLPATGPVCDASVRRPCQPAGRPVRGGAVLAGHLPPHKGERAARSVSLRSEEKARSRRGRPWRL